MKLIKCPYCELYDGSSKQFFTLTKLHDHMAAMHTEKEYRTIDDLIASWKMLGLYEEINVED